MWARARNRVPITGTQAEALVLQRSPLLEFLLKALGQEQEPIPILVQVCQTRDQPLHKLISPIKTAFLQTDPILQHPDNPQHLRPEHPSDNLRVLPITDPPPLSRPQLLKTLAVLITLANNTRHLESSTTLCTSQQPVPVLLRILPPILGFISRRNLLMQGPSKTAKKNRQQQSRSTSTSSRKTMIRRISNNVSRGPLLLWATITKRAHR